MGSYFTKLTNDQNIEEISKNIEEISKNIEDPRDSLNIAERSNNYFNKKNENDIFIYS